MVKILLLFLLLFSTLMANKTLINEDETHENLLNAKIRSYVEADVYEKNSEFIKIIFSPESDYYLNEKVNTVKVVSTLKDNGLLKLFFDKPQEINLHFKTSGPSLFFVKLMSDTLRNIGYYRYVTTASNFNSSEFTWSISLISEYATDPVILQKELGKQGCNIIDIQRNSSTEWTYIVDVHGGFLNVETLQNAKELKLKRSLYSHWLNSSKIKNLRVTSSIRNNWYPYIAYYDKSLHLLKVIKRDEKHKSINLKIPKCAKYIKISDIYSLKNVKDSLTLLPTGTR